MTDPSDQDNLLKTALGEESPEGLPPEQARFVRMIRTAIQTIRLDQLDPVPESVLGAAHALGSELPVIPNWFDRAVAIVMAPLFDDGPRLAHGLRGNELRQCTFATDEHRLDLEVVMAPDDDPEAPGNTHLHGQIEGEQDTPDGVEVIVLVGGTDRVAATTKTEADGRFDLLLPPGTYEFAFRFNDQTLSIGSIDIP